MGNGDFYRNLCNDSDILHGDTAMSAEYTAVYKEDDNGRYQLLMIVSYVMLEIQERKLWLVQLAAELADGDLWAIRLVEGDTIAEFAQVLGDEE